MDSANATDDKVADKAKKVSKEFDFMSTPGMGYFAAKFE